MLFAATTDGSWMAPMIRLPLLSATAMKSYPRGPILGCPYGSKLLRLPSGRRFFLSARRIRLFRNPALRERSGELTSFEGMNRLLKKLQNADRLRQSPASSAVRG